MLLAAFVLSSAGARPCAQDPARELPDAYSAMWWNITNGLPQSSINALIQTASGELWIATHGGLLRFDGFEFQRFDLDTLLGLRSNRITGICEDGTGGLWFATRDGSLHHLDQGVLTETHAVPGPSGVLALVRAADGSLWAQEADGAVLRFADATWTQILPAVGASHYRGLCLCGDGSIGAAAGDELALFEPSGREIARLPAPAEILSLAPDDADGLWVGLENGVAHARNAQLVRFSSSPPISVPVNALADDGHGFLWLGTRGGAMRLATSGPATAELSVSSPFELPRGFDTRSILVDQDANVWLGGGEAGLMRLRPNRVKRFLASDARAVTALCDDGVDGAWIAYADGALEHIDSDTTEAQPVDLGLSGPDPPNLHSLLHDRKHRTWLGLDDTWMRSEPGEVAHFAPILGGRRFPAVVGPMAELPSGAVWLSTTQGQLVRLGPEDEVLEELQIAGPIHALAAAPDGSLWVGGENQLFHVLEGKVSRYGSEDGLPPGSIRDLVPEQDGGVWIASYGGGLVRLAAGRVRRLSRREGLFDSSLTRILVAQDDRFWILSNLGLMVTERADMMAVLGGERATLDPVVVGPETGVNEASYGGPAGFRDQHGRLWFGTISGAIRIDAAAFPFNRRAPLARIQRVRAEDIELPLTGNLEIPPGTRRVSIEFSAPSVTAPERARFRYRLEGFDERWTDSGPLRQAVFTGLAPAAYTFEVSARNEDGVWSTEPCTLRLELVPAWWQTRIFRLTAVLAVIAVLAALHWLRIGIVERRARALLAATEGRARAEEHSSRLRDELAHVARVATAGELATSLAHEVNQPLAAIMTNAQAGRRILARGNAVDGDLDEILRDIAQQGERASEVIRNLRQFLRKHQSQVSVLELNALVGETVPLVRRELQDQSVSLALDLVEGLPQVRADPIQIQQVLVNLIKNACEALAGQPGERRVRLSTSLTEDGSVAVEVLDTGPGIAPGVRDRLFEAYVTTKPEGMGLGLAICRSIVEAHGGRLSARSPSAGGTAFRMDLPASPQS